MGKLTTESFVSRARAVHGARSDPRKVQPEAVHPVIKRLNQDIHRETLASILELEALGYKVVHVWEIDWKAECRKSILGG